MPVQCMQQTLDNVAQTRQPNSVENVPSINLDQRLRRGYNAEDIVNMSTTMAVTQGKMFDLISRIQCRMPPRSTPEGSQDNTPANSTPIALMTLHSQLSLTTEFRNTGRGKGYNNNSNSNYNNLGRGRGRGRGSTPAFPATTYNDEV